MKQPFFLLLVASAMPWVSCQEESTPPASNLTLHYSRPAEFFEESLPLGNGQLGALVYGGVEQERISLNDITLWTGSPDLEPWTPNASKHLAAVREALDREDYPAAELANMKLEGHNSEIYQPLGSILISDLKAQGQPLTGYSRTLDLDKALATVSYQIGEGQRVERECFVSAPDSVVVVHLKSYGTSLSQRLSLACPLPTAVVSAQADGSIVTEGYVAYSTKPEAGKNEWFHYDADRGIHFRTEMRVLAPQGCVRQESDSTLLIDGCDEALLVLTNVTSFNGPYKDPVREGRDYRAAVAQRLQQVMQQSDCQSSNCQLSNRQISELYQQLQGRHLEDYQRLFRRVRLDLGQTPDSIASLDTDQQLLSYGEDSPFNPDLEELYFQFGRYLLISSSRTEGVPANLQGLWNEHITPPWSGNYTANINVEENYWPAEVGALPEMHQSLLSWIMRLPQSGALTAANYYGISDDSLIQGVTPWCMNHNSDLWCMTNPVGYQKESPMWACWPMGGAWVSTHLWEHYTFTADKSFLQRAYPVMKGAAAFCMQWLIEKDGYLMTSPATSPENFYHLPSGFEGATMYGGTADMAMIRELLTDVRQTASVLYPEGDPSGIESQIDTTLAKLVPYKIGSKGNLQEWYHDWDDFDPHHRHQSHLFGLYPGHHLSVDQTPELAQACARTLEIKGDRTTGWSAGWRVNLLARLRDASGAYHMLRTLLAFVHPEGYQGADKRHGGGTYANLFDAHPPFQIDGNFGGTSGMMEMLVQSRWLSDTEAEALLLPALPDQWRAQGHVEGIRLRGGYSLSMTWNEGKVVDLHVDRLSDAQGKLTVRTLDGQTWQF